MSVGRVAIECRRGRLQMDDVLALGALERSAPAVRDEHRSAVDDVRHEKGISFVATCFSDDDAALFDLHDAPT